MANKELVITLESVIQQKIDNLLTSEVGEELVMMDLEQGNYISLNKMGRVIWQQLEQPSVVVDLISYLMVRFKVSEDICTSETLIFLQNMLSQDIISVKP